MAKVNNLLRAMFGKIGGGIKNAIINSKPRKEHFLGALQVLIFFFLLVRVTELIGTYIFGLSNAYEGLEAFLKEQMDFLHSMPLWFSLALNIILIPVFEQLIFRVGIYQGMAWVYGRLMPMAMRRSVPGSFISRLLANMTQGALATLVFMPNFSQMWGIYLGFVLQAMFVRWLIDWYERGGRQKWYDSVKVAILYHMLANVILVIVMVYYLPLLNIVWPGVLLAALVSIVVYGAFPYKVSFGLEAIQAGFSETLVIKGRNIPLGWIRLIALALIPVAFVSGWWREFTLAMSVVVLLDKMFDKNPKQGPDEQGPTVPLR